MWLAGKRIGTLQRTGPERMRFAYLPAIAQGASDAGILSLSLPVQEAPFAPAKTKPFFEGLLPEGDMRRVIADQLGVRGIAGYELLGRIGGECAGAVAVLPENEIPQADRTGSVPLSVAEVTARIDALPTNPLGIDVAGPTRLSLAGVQPKLLLTRDEAGRWASPSPDAPSTYILKPPQRSATGEASFRDLVANEMFCLSVAAQAGIPAARAESQEFGGRDVLIVERFDRRFDPARGVVRLHQEDACQALGRMPESKYEDQPGGVKLIEIFALIDRFAESPATERLRLFDQVVANFVLGNADAHAKNVAILYANPSLGTIAPMYDVVCTAAYPELNTRMALSIGGAREFVDVGPEAIGELAKQTGMNPRQAQRRAADVGRRLAKCATELAAVATQSGSARPIFDEIVDVATRHAAKLSV